MANIKTNGFIMARHKRKPMKTIAIMDYDNDKRIQAFGISGNKLPGSMVLSNEELNELCMKHLREQGFSVINLPWHRRV